jgi:lipoyl(octanoyl) transferase
MSKVKCNIFNLSYKLTDYATSWQYQKVLMEHIHMMRKLNNSVNNSLLIVQHPSVYTLGRGATTANIKFDIKTSIHSVMRIERGGEVTWHGPGQIVAYPIFDLNMHKKDLHWFAHSLEKTVLDTLDLHNIEGERSDVNTGVWVKKNKISAIGVTASRWITMHGIALNVNCDIKNFNEIVPCGISLPGRGVCSMSSVFENKSGTHPSFVISDVAEHWIKSFAVVFNLELFGPNGVDVASSDDKEESVEVERTLKALLEQYPYVKGTTLTRLICN